MRLTTAERKERLPYGAQKEVARELELSESYVSEVLAGETSPKTADAKIRLRKCQVALARRMRPRVPVDVAFGQPELARAS